MYTIRKSFPLSSNEIRENFYDGIQYLTLGAVSASYLIHAHDVVDPKSTTRKVSAIKRDYKMPPPPRYRRITTLIVNAAVEKAGAEMGAEQGA